MRILSTVVSRGRIFSVKGLEMRRAFFAAAVYCFLGAGIFLVCGCKPGSRGAKELAAESQSLYRQSVKAYQQEISLGNDLDRLHFELGKLYFEHGDFQDALAQLKQSRQTQAKRLSAISYYHLGEFTEAFSIFEKNDFADSEARYYYGLTCEKLNLFDQALKIYGGIKKDGFSRLAAQRMGLIEIEGSGGGIQKLDPRVFGLIKESPGQEAYPQAGGLILLAEEQIEVTDDGREISELHYLIKILNDRGKEAFAESQIGYDTTFEKVELEFARTIKPDGTVVNVGTRHIRDVSKYLNFPLYSNVHVYIISFPEITTGAFIEYKVRITRNQLINKKDFIMAYPVQSSEPLIQADLRVIIPSGKELKLKILNPQYNDFGAELSPVTSLVREKKVYDWHFKQIPQIIPESDMPPEVEINPTLILSTFQNWQEIYEWWRGLYQDKISADAGIKKKVDQLTGRKSTPEEKIRAIYNFCASEIRYVAVEYGQAGYEPHRAADIFKNKYGDCKDQAILLVTMLKEAGITAWPVLIATKEYYNLQEDFPSILFNHAIAAVQLDGKLYFMDPTAQTCSFGDLPAGDQARKVLVFKAAGFRIESTPLFPAAHNLTVQDLKIRINKDEAISADKKVETYGVYDQAQRYWLKFTPPELISDTLKETIQGISIGGRLLDYKITNLENLNKPVILEYSFNGSEYLIHAGDLRVMPQIASLDTSLVAKDKRKYAIDFGILDSREQRFEVAIPGTFVIKYIPQGIKEESPWLDFFVDYKKQGNRLLVEQRMQLKKNIITREEYPDFKDFFEQLAKKIKQRAILEKAK